MTRINLLNKTIKQANQNKKMTKLNYQSGFVTILIGTTFKKPPKFKQLARFAKGENLATKNANHN